MNKGRKWKVVLADKDVFYLQKLKRCLERKGDISVVGMTDCGLDVPAMVNELRADIVLMDTLLCECDGFWVLENLKKLSRECVCIMISAIDNDKLVRRAISLGADYYMAKPIQGELLLERIYQLLETDENLEESVHAERKNEFLLSPQKKFGSLEADISAVLSRMGISASIKGYHYIRKAALMAVEDEEVLIGITKGLYPDLGKYYKTTASKVERGIRHAIESAWKKNGAHVYFEVVGYMKVDKPTNGQFIAAVAEYFRLGMQPKSEKIS